MERSSSKKTFDPPSHSAKSLRREGRDIKSPFTLAIKSQGRIQELVCHEILRNLPGKRLVCFGVLGGHEAVVAKIYLDRYRGQTHLKREVNGIRYLESACISTPPILFKGTLSDGKTPILLSQKISAACNLSEQLALDKLAYSAVNQQIKRVIDAIAGMHEAGLSQRDIHPGNFLISENNIMVIDGADIRRHRRTPLPERPSMANLALFVAQFYPKLNISPSELLAFYCRCRNWELTSRLRKRLQKAAIRWSDRREKKFLQKSVRPCTAFIAHNTWRVRMACDRTWHTTGRQSLLDNPDIAIANGTILKDGNSATVVRINYESQPIVVKRYNLKSHWHAFRRSMRPTRAMVSWRNANRLCFMGILTPQPLAIVETRWGPFRGRGYFITTYLAGEAIDVIINRNRTDMELLASYADLVTQLLKQLYQLRLSHSDLKASNLLLSDERLYLLDLDGMRKHFSAQRFKRAFHRDIQRLLENWKHDTVFQSMLKVRIREVFQDD